MGWLGWTPQAARAADVNDIRIALDGRIDLLAMMGLAKPKPRPGPVGATVPEWQAFKKRHNQIQRAREGQVRRRRERG